MSCNSGYGRTWIYKHLDLDCRPCVYGFASVAWGERCFVLVDVVVHATGMTLVEFGQLGF